MRKTIWIVGVLGMMMIMVDGEKHTLDKTPVYKNGPLSKIDAKDLEELKQRCGYVDKSVKKRQVTTPAAVPTPSTANMTEGPTTTLPTNITNHLTTKRPSMFSWAVVISHTKPNNLYCTGILISPWHVITAGHCAYDMKIDEWTKGEKFVIAGAKCVLSKHKECKGEKSIPIHVKVAKVVVTKEWTSGYDNSHGGDLAIMQLEKPLEYSPTLSPACLGGVDLDLPFNTSSFIHWGWGYFDASEKMSPVLRYLTNVSIAKCPETKKTTKGVEMLMEDTLCAETGNIDKYTRPGDSGSGLEYITPNGDHIVVGTLSYFYEGSESESYATDLRQYVDLICAETGVCYMNGSNEKKS